MAQSIEELQALVDAWQKKEDEGGTPTSKPKLAAAKAALEEAQAAAKPKLDAEELAYFSNTLLRKPIIEKLPDEVKDEYGFTKLENKQIEEYLTRPKVNSDGAWKAFVESNKKAEKETPKETWNRLDQNEKRRQQQLVKNWGLDKDPSIKQQVINYSPNKVNKDVYQPKKFY